jgi:hypothetical protein
MEHKWTRLRRKRGSKSKERISGFDSKPLDFHEILKLKRRRAKRYPSRKII